MQVLYDALRASQYETWIDWKDYLANSVAARRSANTRQRATIGVLATLLLGAIAAGGLAWVQYGRTQAALGREGEARELAEQRLQEAETARQVAEAAQTNEAEQRQIAERNEKAAEQSAQEAQEALTQAETARAAEAEQRQVAVGALQRAEAGEAEANRQAVVAQEQTQIAQRNEATARQATQRAEQETRRAETQALNAEIQADALTVENLIASDLTFLAMRQALQLGKTIQVHEGAPTTSALAKTQGVSATPPSSIQPSTRLQAVSTLQKIYHYDGYLQRHSLQGHRWWVYSVSFSPDGQTLASFSADGTIILWNLNLDDLMAKSCDWLYEVEFANAEGETLALQVLEPEQFIVIWQSSTKTWVPLGNRIAALLQTLPEERQQQVLNFARSLQKTAL